jgi:predicted RNA-binding Zn-ribbon protein involved in translation (DUF1610 family)
MLLGAECPAVPPRPCGTAKQNERRSMPNVAHLIKFQCPNCGNELEQSIGRLKSAKHMQCQACGIGINIDTDRLANATDEIRKAIEKVPPEITIKFFR